MRLEGMKKTTFYKAVKEYEETLKQDTLGKKRKSESAKEKNPNA